MTYTKVVKINNKNSEAVRVAFLNIVTGYFGSNRGATQHLEELFPMLRKRSRNAYHFLTFWDEGEIRGR